MVNSKLAIGLLSAISILGGVLVVNSIHQVAANASSQVAIIPHRLGKVLAATNTAPNGYLDVANCDTFGGWAYDPDASADSIYVAVYNNGTFFQNLFAD